MPAVRPILLSAILASGCASSTPPRPPPSFPGEAVEQARREERQKIMQQYWYEHTVAPAVPAEAGSAPWPALAYPAGTYAGIRFGARQAPDPSLSEPNR